MKNNRVNLLLLLFVIGTLIPSTSASESRPPMEHKKVVEANHYYSDTQPAIEYTIQNVEKGRSLIFVLRNITTTQASLPVNKSPINITLRGGGQKSQCVFDSYDDLCVIKEIKQTSNMSLEIKCSKLPCDLSWTIFQPIAKQPTSQQSLQDLYELSDTQKHMIGIITCNDPSVKTFKEDVKIYSDNPFSSTVSGNVMYYLFNNEKKGFMFAEVALGSRNCAKFSVYNVQYDIKVSEQASLRDFIRNDSLSIFKLNENPSTDFMIDASMHELDKTQSMKSGLQIKITGQKGGNRHTLQQYTVRPFVNKTDFPFKYIVKAISKQYSNIQVEFKSTGNVIMVNFVLVAENRQQIETGEISYIHILSGQKILYKVPADSQATDDEMTYIYVSNKINMQLNATQCKVKTGCEFQVTAKADAEGMLYLTDNQKENKIEVVVAELRKQVTKKGRQSQMHYYKTPLKAKKAFQMVVNSPNVIVYTARQGYCQSQQPSQSCYQNVFNYHNPAIYQPQKDSTLYLTVDVLDNCKYTLTRIDEDQEYIELKDGQSFTYLMDDREDKVMFKFKLDTKQRVGFNLISPLNSLYLLVENGNRVPSTKEMNIASTDGYISFSKNEIKQLEFTILIKKTDEFAKKFVHFTLIASTKNANLHLQPGIAHYETLKPEQFKVFAFEFSPKDEYIVSFYTHNAKAKDKVNIEMMVSNKDEWIMINPKHSFIIDKQSDVLQLKDVSRELCESEGAEQCEIFIKIINTMDSEIDLTLNLMVKNSIIELKDGIWQSYAENSIAVSSNFYFYPKHKNKSVEIMYRSVFTDLRITYAIWKADDKNIDPTEWPFPKSVPKQSQENQIKLYKPTKHVSIDHTVLNQCWPSCVVLIALIKNSTQIKGEFDYELQNGEFSIMASNNYVQIPQKTRIDSVMKQNESKYFMIDLKYALQKEDSAITLFTTSTLGYYELKGSLYSEKNPNCPTDDDQSEFKFGNIETQIKVSTILKKIAENDMDEHRNVYLCLLVKAYTNTKLSLQYTSDEGTIKVLDLDSFETVNLDKSAPKIYQVSANQEYYIKFTRNKGFPFVSFAKCKQGDDYEECMENFIKSEDKGKQLVSKTQSFTEQPCAKCIVFIKISSQQPAEVDIHLQSKYTEIQLKENKMISDFTNQNQENRYSILALRNEETIINIQVTEGLVEVHVTDFNKVNITKTNEKDKNLVHIVIPAQDHKRKQADKSLDIMGMAWMTSFGLSDTFTSLHLSIKALNGKGATSYTITYSSGERQTYLQDGLITDYVLEPEKQTTFFYENPSSQGHGYLSISMDNSANLHNLNLRMYYLVDKDDEDTAVQIAAQMPPMRKRTPNPTVLYSLPAQNFIVIKMKNPSNTEQKVSVGINHQEVILLPFNHEFPFPLHKKQSINFLIDVNNPGYLKLSLRKCDESNPELSYTFDYDGFQKGQFTYSSILNEDPKFEYFIKSKEVGTLYVNIKSEEDLDSLMSIKVDYSPEKIKSTVVKPGNKGILQYQLLDSTTAELSFTEVSCSGSESSSCHKEYDYFTISAKQKQELYSQTVCPTQYFSTIETVSTNPLPLNKIKANPDSNGKVTFQYILMDHISYVGVKAINSRTGEQIYYRPIQIVTIWGQISRTSTTHRFTIVGVSLCLFCVVLIWCRRNARKGYKPLQEDG